MFLCRYSHLSRCLLKPETLEASRGGVAGGYELPNVGAGIQLGSSARAVPVLNH